MLCRLFCLEAFVPGSRPDDPARYVWQAGTRFRIVTDRVIPAIPDIQHGLTAAPPPVWRRLINRQEIIDDPRIHSLLGRVQFLLGGPATGNTGFRRTLMVVDHSESRGLFHVAGIAEGGQSA